MSLNNPCHQKKKNIFVFSNGWNQPSHREKSPVWMTIAARWSRKRRPDVQLLPVHRIRHDDGSQEGHPSSHIAAGNKQTKHNCHSLLPSFIRRELVKGTADKQWANNMYHWYCTDCMDTTGQFSRKIIPTSWIHTSQNPKEQLFVLVELALMSPSDCSAAYKIKVL